MLKVHVPILKRLQKGAILTEIIMCIYAYSFATKEVSYFVFLPETLPQGVFFLQTMLTACLRLEDEYTLYSAEREIINKSCINSNVSIY